jgi:hypothetical protein
MRSRRDLQRRSSIAATSAAVIGIAVFLVGGGRARAQSAEAEALFEDGNRLMHDGRFAEACEAFEASNRIEPRAGTLIWLGDCRVQNHQLASAWSAYRDALTRVKNPDKLRVAMKRAAEIERRLSYLTVSVPDASQLDGLVLTRDGKPFDPILWNRELPVDGGDYVIAGRAPDHEDWQDTAHVPIEGARITIKVPRLGERMKPIAAPPSPPSSPLASLPPRTEALGPPAAPAPGMFTLRRKIAIGAAGISVAAVVVGAVVGESSRTKTNDAFKLCPDPAMTCVHADQANALIESSRRRSLEANIAFGAGAVAAIAAGVLWLTGAPDTESPRRVGVVPRVAPGEAALVIQTRF